MNITIRKKPALSKLPIGMLMAFAVALIYSICSNGIHMPSISSAFRYAANDTIAYNLGGEHARELINAGDDSIRINYILLETRARETGIRKNFGKEVSDAYIKGFEAEIRSYNDSLARCLFSK